MANQIRLHVWGDYACFTRPEMKVERVIRFESVRRNELGGKISAGKVSGAMKRKSVADLYTLIEDDRQQRAATVLKNVAYVIEAHITLTAQAGEADNITKHIEMFTRRARKGQCFQQPCLGVREFPADFALIDEGEPLPPSELLTSEANRDLGWMLHDIDFEHGNTPHFFRAEMKEGVILVPPFYAEEVKA